MSEKTIIFIDAGFLSKLSIHLGNGKYLKFDIVKLVEIFAKKENLEIEHIYYYTAPPFISGKPNESEKRRKENYDKFIFRLSKIPNFTVKEGRCQRLKENGKFKFAQKGVDTHLTMDLIKMPFINPKIKRIILVACDTDFVPAINDIYSQKVETILYTYFDSKRNSNFSQSNELLQNVKKYVLISKDDFNNSSL